jgi:hypothetical protein
MADASGNDPEHVQPVQEFIYIQFFTSKLLEPAQPRMLGGLPVAKSFKSVVPPQFD